MKFYSLGIKIVAILAGGVAGFLYWKSYGCTAGCTITSTWYGSVLMGGILGNLLEGMIVDFRKKEIK